MGKKIKIILPISLFLIVSLFIVILGKQVFAADLDRLVQKEVDALAEAQETLDIPSSEVNERKADQLQEEVEALINEAEEMPALVKKGWAGEVVSLNIEEGTIILPKDGGNRTVTFDEETVLLDEKRQNITAEDLKEGDFLVIMGYQDRLSPQKLNAKRILKSQPQEITRQSFFGKISDISQEESVFSLEENDGQILEVMADKAKVVKNEEGKPVKASFTSLEKGARVVLVGEKGEAGRLEAILVYLWTNDEEVSLKPTEGVSEEK